MEKTDAEVVIQGLLIKYSWLAQTKGNGKIFPPAYDSP